jgi:hypothetical protein
MPALVAGIHVFLQSQTKDVDGRDKPGHDASVCEANSILRYFFRVGLGSGRSPIRMRLRARLAKWGTKP